MWLQRHKWCDATEIRLKQIPHYSVNSPEKPIHIIQKIRPPGEMEQPALSDALHQTDESYDKLPAARWIQQARVTPRARVREDSSWIREEHNCSQHSDAAAVVLPPQQRLQNNEKVIQWHLKNVQPLQKSTESQRSSRANKHECAHTAEVTAAASNDKEPELLRQPTGNDDVDSQVWRNYRRVQQEIQRPLRYIAHRLRSYESGKSRRRSPELEATGDGDEVSEEHGSEVGAARGSRQVGKLKGVMRLKIPNRAARGKRTAEMYKEDEEDGQEEVEEEATGVVILSVQKLQRELKKLERQVALLDAREVDSRRKMEQQLSDIREENLRLRRLISDSHVGEHSRQSKRNSSKEANELLRTRQELRQLRRASRGALAGDSLERSCLQLRSELKIFHQRVTLAKDFLLRCSDVDSC